MYKQDHLRLGGVAPPDDPASYALGRDMDLYQMKEMTLTQYFPA